MNYRPKHLRPQPPQCFRPPSNRPSGRTRQLSTNSDVSSIKSDSIDGSNNLNDSAQDSSPPNIRGWRYSDEKQTIIACLNDPSSDIHLMPKEQIWRRYAHNYDQKKTITKLEYLLHSNTETGRVPFLRHRIVSEIMTANVRRARKLSLGRRGAKRAEDGTCCTN